MGYKTRDKSCSYEGCTETYKDHEWGHKKAQREGWFLQMNGDSWCPDHNPPWVKEWRNKKRREKYAEKNFDAEVLRDLSEFDMTVTERETIELYHDKDKCTFNVDLDSHDLDKVLMDAFDHLKECDK